MEVLKKIGRRLVTKHYFYAYSGRGIMEGIPKNLITTLETPQETIDRIINDVSQRSGIKKEKILSRNRRKEIVAARFACMYLLRKEAFMTFAAIGRVFDRDHSTAMHALRTVENLLETNDYLMVKNTWVVLDGG